MGSKLSKKGGESAEVNENTPVSQKDGSKFYSSPDGGTAFYFDPLDPRSPKENRTPIKLISEHYNAINGSVISEKLYTLEQEEAKKSKTEKETSPSTGTIPSSQDGAEKVVRKSKEKKKKRKRKNKNKKANIANVALRENAEETRDWKLDSPNGYASPEPNFSPSYAKRVRERTALGDISNSPWSR